MNARDQARALRNGSGGTMEEYCYQDKKSPQPLTSSHKNYFPFNFSQAALT